MPRGKQKGGGRKSVARAMLAEANALYGKQRGQTQTIVEPGTYDAVFDSFVTEERKSRDNRKYISFQFGFNVLEPDTNRDSAHLVDYQTSLPTPKKDGTAPELAIGLNILKSRARMFNDGEAPESLAEALEILQAAGEGDGTPCRIQVTVRERKDNTGVTRRNTDVNLLSVAAPSAGPAPDPDADEDEDDEDLADTDEDDDDDDDDED